MNKRNMLLATRAIQLIYNNPSFSFHKQAIQINYYVSFIHGSHKDAHDPYHPDQQRLPTGMDTEWRKYIICMIQQRDKVVVLDKQRRNYTQFLTCNNFDGFSYTRFTRHSHLAIHMFINSQRTGYCAYVC